MKNKLTPELAQTIETLKEALRDALRAADNLTSDDPSARRAARGALRDLLPRSEGHMAIGEDVGGMINSLIELEQAQSEDDDDPRLSMNDEEPVY